MKWKIALAKTGHAMVTMTVDEGNLESAILDSLTNGWHPRDIYITKED